MQFNPREVASAAVPGHDGCTIQWSVRQGHVILTFFLYSPSPLSIPRFKIKKQLIFALFKWQQNIDSQMTIVSKLQTGLPNQTG